MKKLLLFLFIIPFISLSQINQDNNPTTHYYDCILKEDLDKTGILRCQVLNNTQAQPTDTRKYNVACYNAFERNEKFRCSASFFKE